MGGWHGTRRGWLADALRCVVGDGGGCGSCVRTFEMPRHAACECTMVGNKVVKRARKIKPW